MQQAPGVNVSEPPRCEATGDHGATVDRRSDLSGIGNALRRNGGEADAAVVPVIAEELQVGRQSVETGRVRVTKLVREHEEVVDQPTVTEEVTVERVPVDRFLDGPVGPRQEGETLIVPVVEEVLVVERRLRLKEEVRITRRVSQTRQPQTVMLRSQEVRVERLPGETAVEGM